MALKLFSSVEKVNLEANQALKIRVLNGNLTS